jgi:ferredoxin/flavodoxin---NADP+ reductase
MPPGTPDSPLRVAIIGSGPAGAYAAGHLFKDADLNVEVDLFDRLPTPWGLVRAGVAPDHPKIKSVIRVYEKTAVNPGFRFYGNVEVGTDVTHAELMERYHAVIYSYGAGTDRHMGIPGEDLPGSWAATEFVAWYNGHPDYRDREFDLSAKRAVVIGNGNVAADVTRVLTRRVDELARTDVADHALEALRESQIEEVVVLGRRGPAQAAFTSAELRELGHMDGVDIRVDAFELDPVSEEWLDDEGTFTARKNVQLLREFAAREPGDAPRRIDLRFLRSPVAIRGADRVEAIEIGRNEIVRDDSGTLRARALDEPAETIEAGLVLRSVGYRAVPLPDVPFDERAYVLPNVAGRVLGPDGEVLPGVYTVGWIKRGPTGILGTNKRDAEETIGCLADDLHTLPEPAGRPIDELLAERTPDVVTADGWHAIDAAERERGRGAERPRVKLASRDELLAAARP